MTQPTPIFVYAANPYGFTYSTLTFKQDWYAAIRDAHPSIVLLDPWADTQDRPLMEKGAHNEEQIRLCHFVVAGLDGTDVDSGTAAEIGYARALSRPVIGFRADLRAAHDHPHGQINLQVEYFIRTNGTIVQTLSELTQAVRQLAIQFVPLPEHMTARPCNMIAG